MNPSNFNSKGSFGIPKEMADDLNKARDRQAPPVPPPGMDLKVPPATTAMPQAVPLQEAAEVVKKDAGAERSPEEIAEFNRQQQEAAIKRDKEIIEKTLEIKIETNDVNDYIFKGRMTKEVNMITGHLKGTLQTLNPIESMAIDAHMAEFRESKKFTEDGYKNERTVVMLSYAWTHVNGKSIGKDRETREKNIRHLGNLVVDAATNAFTDFNYLIQISLSEKNFLKK